MTATKLSYCGEEVRTHDHDRFLTCLFAPSARREDLFALYAFNLEVAKTAEVVSEPMLGRIRLQWWREALDGVYQGTPRKHAVVEPLAAAVKKCDLPRTLFDAIIDGRELDLEDEPLRDLQSFETYTAMTSAALTRLAAMVLGVKAEDALQAADHVGSAWAMIGLLRAVPFHAARKRLFLPVELTDKYDLERGDLFELRPSKALAKITEEIAKHAEVRLREARTRNQSFDRSTIAAVLPAVIARQHLKNLAGAGWNPLDPSAQGPNHGLALKVFFAYLLARF